MNSLFDAYFHYVQDTEPPLIYHRWSLIAAIGAFLGRRYYFPFGHKRIFANPYIMLIGNPGTRKSTAINMASDILAASGYLNFSANKTRLEKFLLDLEGETAKDGEKAEQNIVMKNLFGDDAEEVEGLEPREVFINAGEFNVFMPRGDMDFLGLLGDLWDWDNDKIKWKYRLKNSKSVHIFQPTISILAGNTHAGFQEVFPPQAIGQGFLSRLLLVYSDPSGKKITFPKPVNKTLQNEIIESFRRIREKVLGPATLTAPALNMLDIIYRSWHELEDQRFKHYSTRRFTHLLKLILICSAARISSTVDTNDVLLANSILSFTENAMPKALGEFGKSRHAEAANKLMQALYETKKPLKMDAMWRIVQHDMEKMSDLGSLLQSLQKADKIQVVMGEGFLPKQKPLDRKQLYVDFNLLKEHKDG